MDRVLPEIDPRLADYAVRQLRGRGIDIRLGTTLEEVTATSARISTGETVGTRTVVWTAGVVPHPSARNLGLAVDEHGRIVVDDHLRVSGEDDVWALGDAAAVPDPAKPGRLCPPTSQHAIRQGRTAGRNVAASLGIGEPAPFSYKTRGAFVNLGRYKAVARVGPFTFRGFPAWWLARTYHVSQIPGTARKVRAVMDWTIGLPFKRDIAEVGSIGHPRPLRADAYERSGTAPQLRLARASAMPYQFLHIGKTGGTLIRQVLRSLPEEHRSQFRLLGHDARLSHAIETRPDMPVFFSVRRPETLFVSAFNSRLRQGKPQYDRSWGRRERIVFSVFKTPNDLAESLSATDSALKACAELSMLSINHIRKGLQWYLGNTEFLEKHREKIAFILLQEELEQDLRTFAARVGVPLASAQISPAERLHGIRARGRDDPLGHGPGEHPRVVPAAPGDLRLVCGASRPVAAAAG